MDILSCPCVEDPCVEEPNTWTHTRIRCSYPSTRKKGSLQQWMMPNSILHPFQQYACIKPKRISIY